MNVKEILRGRIYPKDESNCHHVSMDITLDPVAITCKDCGHEMTDEELDK